MASIKYVRYGWHGEKRKKRKEAKERFHRITLRNLNNCEENTRKLVSEATDCEHHREKYKEKWRKYKENGKDTRKI